MDPSSSSGSTSRVRTVWTRFRSGRLSSTFALLAVLSAGILAGSMLTGNVSARQQSVNSSDAQPIVIPSPVDLSTAFTHIVKQVGPAVVNIDTETLPKQTAHPRRNFPQGGQGAPGDNGDQGDNDMQDFFNRFFGGGGGQGGDQGQMPDGGERRALGSGFIVDPRGYILTNDHVIDKADRIFVKLSSDPEDSLDPGRRATVVGFDKDTDIAVIKIDTNTPLPTVKLGNSDGAQVGDWVLAIGTPFGQRNTVSAGIVSAKNRSIEDSGEDGIGQGQFQRFIQTDAAINPGNSGGPLIDMAGQVIGMNTAIYTQSAGSEGIGFAMPSNTLASVYNQLIGPEHKVIRGSIGIEFQAAQSSAVGRVYGFANGGVLVSSVVPNGPSAKAGLQPGDIIVSVDGRPIKDGDELVNLVSSRRPGTTVRLGYLRNGKQQSVEVTIEDRAKLYANIEGGAENNNAPGPTDVGQSKLGITVQPTTQATATKLNIPGGVTVTSVTPGSFADNIGMAPGVVITAINRRPVTGEDTYRDIVQALKSGDDVVFVIRDPRVQGGGNTYIGGTLP